MGVMALGFSFGGALDVAGTLYHMLNHSPNKSLMFFGAGNMMRAYDAKRIAGIYTYLSRAERRVRRSGHVRGAGPGLGLAAKRDCKERRPHPQFLPLLRTELAFYVGCLNLHERLLKLQAPFAYPRATRPETVRFHCIERYDVTLALRKSGRPVANHVNANGKTLIVATGDNQGGKTTFLRSFGLAQLMMQAGMFVAADRLEASIDGGRRVVFVSLQYDFTRSFTIGDWTRRCFFAPLSTSFEQHVYWEVFGADAETSVAA